MRSTSLFNHIYRASLGIPVGSPPRDHESTSDVEDVWLAFQADVALALQKVIHGHFLEDGSTAYYQSYYEESNEEGSYNERPENKVGTCTHKRKINL